jgi:hypothetical protein
MSHSGRWNLTMPERPANNRAMAEGRARARAPGGGISTPQRCAQGIRRLWVFWLDPSAGAVEHVEYLSSCQTMG